MAVVNEVNDKLSRVDDTEVLKQWVTWLVNLEKEKLDEKIMLSEQGLLQ